MGVLEYVRRALSGGAARSGGPPDASITPIGIIVVGIFVLGIAGWLLGFGRQVPTQGSDCSFYIAETDAPFPVTDGDAAARLDVCVRLERVESDAKRTLGLSNRPSMRWDRGMLFDFEKPDEYCMWMKDMYFSLDMIWLNEQLEIVGLREDISPKTFPKSFCGPETARYVVEVNAGVVKAGDLRIGQHLNL